MLREILQIVNGRLSFQSREENRLQVLGFRSRHELPCSKACSLKPEAWNLRFDNYFPRFSPSLYMYLIEGL
jgi:hypothetical protein